MYYYIQGHDPLLEIELKKAPTFSKVDAFCVFERYMRP
ncbi:MAG: hypothetical protein ACI9CO_000835 [Candidatus Azotimanducaceae bacterium]|jgi:hypothetical protein